MKELPGGDFSVSHITDDDLLAFIETIKQRGVKDFMASAVDMTAFLKRRILRDIAIGTVDHILRDHPEPTGASVAAIISGIYLGFALAANFPQPPKEDRPPIQLTESSVFKPTYDISEVN